MNQGDPCHTVLHEAHLDRTVRNDSFLYYVYAFLITEKTLVEDACNRTFSVTANVFSCLDTAFSKSVLYLLKKFLGVGLREGQIKNSLDGKSKTKNRVRER